MDQTTSVPGIYQYNEFNPTLHSPSSEYDIPFAQTKESLVDAEIYRKFLENAISRFRHSRTYKNYKSHLMSMGLDACQIHGNIHSNEDDEMATIEMHHNILTIFDVALILAEHTLNIEGKITTFDLVDMLKREHTQHRVATVMLTKTVHQLVHADRDFIIPPSMCFGDWITFLQLYRDGITRDIAYKLMYYLQNCIKNNNQLNSHTCDAVGLRDWIYQWSEYNANDVIINSAVTD